MSKSHLSWFAVTLVLAGVAIITGHPAWGTVTGSALILLAAGVAAGAARLRSERGGAESKGARVSNTLVTLSSAAIIAVYAAGFQRTRAAADEFEARAARRRAHPPITAALALSHATAQPTAQPLLHEVASFPAPAAKKDRAQLAQPQTRSTTSASTLASARALTENPQPGITTPVSAPPTTTPDVPAAPAVAPTAAVTAAPAAAQPADPPADPAAASADVPKLHYHDGTYQGKGRSAHGDITASVVVQGGKVVSTEITKCGTAYSCSWIAALPGEVLIAQNATDIQFVTGATDSCYAFQDAVTAALFRAQIGE